MLVLCKPAVTTGKVTGNSAQQSRGVPLSREGDVSPRLQPALEALAASLQHLSASLDAVVFSDMWRAAAVAITRTIFNDVATEARFSAEVPPLPAPNS